jgi:hypothetical protein
LKRNFLAESFTFSGRPRRVGKINVAVRFHHHVIRAVKSLTLEAIRYGDELAILPTRHTPVALLAGDEPTLFVMRESVRPGSAAARFRASAAARLEKNGNTAARVRFENRVLRHIGEKQVSARHPHWPFGPVKSLGELLDDNVLCEQRIQRRVKSFNGGECARGSVHRDRSVRVVRSGRYSQSLCGTRPRVVRRERNVNNASENERDKLVVHKVLSAERQRWGCLGQKTREK